MTTRAWTPEFAMRMLALPTLLFMIPTFAIPVGIVLWRGVEGPELTLVHFSDILSNSVYLGVLAQTFETAVLSTSLALLIGFPIAWVLTRLPPFWSGLGMACVLVPLWTSVVTRTYAWLALLGRRGMVNELLIDWGWIETPLSLLYNGFAVQIGMVQVLLPMMVLPLISTMRQLDQTKMMAAAVLGANPLRCFWHIYLPMCLPGILAGCLLVFITALGFYVTPALLGDTQNTMIAVLIEQQVSKTLNWPLASAFATTLLLMVLLSIALFALIARLRGVRIAAG